jgi:hypothetical protein
MKKLFLLPVVLIGSLTAQEVFPGSCGKFQDPEVSKIKEFEAIIFLTLLKPYKDPRISSLNEKLNTEWQLDFTSNSIIDISHISGCKQRGCYFSGHCNLPPIPTSLPTYLFFNNRNQLKMPGSIIALTTKAGKKVLFKLWYEQNNNRNNI